MFFGMRIRSLIGRRDWREDVSAYMDGELSLGDRVRVEMQLAQSAEMREYLADLEEMRSVLRAFEPAASATPFQLTTEMLNDSARMAVQPTIATRALRLSMSTAAIGVATFAAVMVFDAVDSPTVTFTTTSAGDDGGGVPTAAVVTDEIEVETESSTSQQVVRLEAGAAAQEQQAEESATVASVEVEEEEQQAAQEAAWQSEQEAEQEQAYEAAEEEAQQQVEAASQDAAADDPSRRAITAGRGGSDGETGDADQVTAEDVVQQQDDVEAKRASVDETEASEPQAAAVAEQSDQEQAEATDSSTAEVDEDQSQAVSQTQTERRTVATSVRHSQSDWPLEQRPRSSTVQLARDPSWEEPVQIVLAVIAIGATLLWLSLTIVDRRRRS